MKNRELHESGSSIERKPYRLPIGKVTLGLAIVALLAVSGAAAACGGGGGGGGGGGNHGGNHGKLTNDCSAAGPVDALEILLGSPQTSAVAGSTLSASYEVEVVGFTSADLGSIIHFPSVYVKIPLTSTTKFALNFAPTDVTISGSGWSSPITESGTLASATNFNGGVGSATLSTVSIAVMQKDAAGPLTIAVQWGWTLTSSGVTSSLWSTPSSTATLPALPSIFQPAPWVGLLATTTTTAAPAGSLFEAKLNGSVGRTTFNVSVEYPNGTEIVCKLNMNYRWTPCFVVKVPLIYLNGTPLAPGNYIVHIHDSIGAIVHTISVTVVASSGGGSWGHGQHQKLSCSCQGGGGNGNGGYGSQKGG
jgi:hypothetical protein